MKAKAFSLTQILAAPAVLAALLLSAAPALADAGDWIIRVRAIQLAPDVSSSVTVIGGSVDIDPDEVPEIDFTYFITNNWAAELILATTRHRVSDNNSTLGNVDLGKVSLIPPILTLQYHFMPDGKYRPYVGDGINYTIFYNEKAPGTTVTAISYEDGFGWALQAGIDIGITDRVAINFDVKKAYLSSDVNLNNGAILADVDLDPWVFGIGLAYRF